MKKKEIKKLSKDEIMKNIDKFKKDLFNFRFQKINSQVTNPAKIGETKKTIAEYNNAVDLNTAFDPTVLDGKSTLDLTIKKSNWAQRIDEGPFRAFPVTGGITFTYGGLKINKQGSVLNKNDKPISGLFACGELVGGVFFNGYPGGSGLTSGAVFGRIAGYGAAQGG